MVETAARWARERPRLAVFTAAWIFGLAAYRPWLTHFYGDTWSLFNGYALAGIASVLFPHNEHFAPVSQLVLFTEFSLFGMNPLLYGITSISIHALNAVMVFELAGMLTGAAAARWFAALGFAMSGVLFETVTWEAAQEITLALSFGLSAHRLLVRFHATGDGWWAAAATCSLACSLLSHTYGLAFVPALALFAWASGAGAAGRRTLTAGAAAGLLACGIYGGLRLAAGHATLGGPSAGFGVTISPGPLLQWLGLAVWAGGIKPLASTWISPVHVASAALAAALWKGRSGLHARWRFAPWMACLVVTPHLLAGAARIARFGVDSAVQGRYQYLPLAGMALAAAWVVGAAWEGLVTGRSRFRFAVAILLSSLAAHALAGAIYIRTNSVWYYHYRQVVHFLDRMVTSKPAPPPPGMIELAGEPVLSHFACPYKLPLYNVLRIYGASGWPVDPDRISLRDHLHRESVRNQSLLAGRGLESGRWTVTGDARILPLQDGKGTVAIELSAPDSAVRLEVEEFNDYKPLYTFVADASLAGGEYNTEMRILFKDKSGATRDQVVSHAFGKPEFLTIMLTALAPLETRTVHVEFAPAMPGRRFCRTELRNVMVFRHPVFAPLRPVAVP